MEAAGIAPASQSSQAETQHGSYVDTPPPCLHTACTDLALRELVANWHRLTAVCREKIVEMSQNSS
jgi:hypothetical protein